MATWTVTAHDGADWNFTISATNLIGFYGASYGDKITVGEYQDSMHIRTSAGTDTDACGSPHLIGIKYISSNQCDKGGGTINCNTLLTTDCIKFNFSHTSSVATENGLFYAYDGNTVTSAPTGVTFQALEQGDTNWTNAEGQASGVSLGNQSASTSHDFYVAMSASPESVGEKTAFAVRAELTYY